MRGHLRFLVSANYFRSLGVIGASPVVVAFPVCALQVGPAVLGYGSGGTVVFSGELDGRPVAVKRMLRQFYEVARKEIDALILADEHPNIVRWAYMLLAAAFSVPRMSMQLRCPGRRAF